MRVKKALAFFVCLLVFPTLVVIPNILQKGTLFKTGKGGAADYFNVDALEAVTARFLLDMGLSLKPSKVRIGDNGWLFLGDKYQRVYSRSIGKDKRDKKIIPEVQKSIGKWEKLYDNKGVKGPYILIAPNKHSVYWEYLDAQLNSAALTSTDNLMHVLSDNPAIIDPRAHFRLLKKSSSYPMYYKTDTHWNNYGATEAYKLIRQQWGALLPDVRWLKDNEFKALESTSRSGGDLAGFLKLSDYLLDTEVSEEINFPPGFSVQSKSYFDGLQKPVSDNLLVTSQNEPLLIESVNALNEKRVLWLRDSFGTHLSPLFTVTFSQVVHWHYGKSFKRQEMLRKLLEEFQPEIVIMTVVERGSIKALSIPPEPEVFKGLYE